MICSQCKSKIDKVVTTREVLTKGGKVIIYNVPAEKCGCDKLQYALRDGIILQDYANKVKEQICYVEYDVIHNQYKDVNVNDILKAIQEENQKSILTFDSNLPKI